MKPQARRLPHSARKALRWEGEVIMAEWLGHARRDVRTFAWARRWWVARVEKARTREKCGRLFGNFWCGFAKGHDGPHVGRNWGGTADT